MPGQYQESLRDGLVLFLAERREMLTPEGRQYLVSATGFEHLWRDLNLNGAPAVVSSDFVDAVAAEGSASLLALLDRLSTVLPLGVEDQAWLAAQREGVADLSPEAWQVEFTPRPPKPDDHKRRHDFYRHIPLPPNYIPRPELLAEVRERLLAGTNSVALTSAIQVMQADVLHGMGGIGKSVLARALCDDPEVQAAFPDGILWVTLGQTPDLTVRLREWIETLGGTVRQTAPTIDQMRNALAEALADKTCLLIVDDAWKKAHLDPFCAGSPACRLLITTRDAAIIEGMDAEVCPVPVMAPNQAVALLGEWAQGRVAASEPAIKAQIVERLGYLPLAVRLAGAQLRQKDPGQWLASFSSRQLVARRVETTHDSLQATFDLSLDDLDSTRRRLYAVLAIFREDEPTPVVAIARLWSALAAYSADATNDLLDDLADRALLSRSQGGSTAITVHDLLRDFMSAEIGDEGFATAHRALLAAYRATQQGNGWHTAPDDGYLYNHLAYHLDQLAHLDGSAEAELQRLFADQNWLHAKVPGSGYLYDGYLADLWLAWRGSDGAARRQIDRDQEPLNLADCVRCAMIRSSINSLAASYDPSLVARAVETGVWPAERALNIARLVAAPAARAALLFDLLQLTNLEPDERRQAEEEGLTAALAVKDECRGVILAKLASYLTGEARDLALQAGLATALTIDSEWKRSDTLAALAPQLTGESLEAALAAALAIRDEWSRAQSLAALAPQLTGESPEAALARALAIADDRSRTHVLVALAPQLTGEARDEALHAGLAAALAIGDEHFRAQSLAALGPQLTGESLQAAWAAALAIGYQRDRAEALAMLAPQLTGEAREQVLQAGLASALTIRDEWSRAQAVAKLAPQLTGESAQTALAAALTIGDHLSRAQALTPLAPQLSGEAREEALRAGLGAALAIGDDRSRTPALAALAPQLTGEAREQALSAGLVAALAIGDKRFRADALAALAPHLTGKLLQEGLDSARGMGDEWSRAHALAALAKQLAGEAREQALQAALAAALAIEHESSRVEFLASLAPQLAGEAKEQALRAGLAGALAISDELGRAHALGVLAPQLTGEALQAGLAAALAIEHEGFRADALASLAPQLSGETLQEGLVAAQAMGDEWSRAQALAALAPQLSGAAREQVLQAGLAAAQAIEYRPSKVRALAMLAPQMTGAARERALQAGLAAVWEISSEQDRVNALRVLVPQLTGEAREEALQAALAIDDQHCRVEALAALAPYLTGEVRGQALQTALATALAICDKWSGARALAALAPHLTGETLQEGLVGALAIDSEVYRAEVLAALAPQMSSEGRGQALQAGLAAALAIEDDRYQAVALAGVLPYLTDPATCLRGLRHAMTAHLSKNLVDRKRQDVLMFCADEALFTPPILSPQTLSSIARHIIEICQEWEWL